jgi:hypothetical protein
VLCEPQTDENKTSEFGLKRPLEGFFFFFFFFSFFLFLLLLNYGVLTQGLVLCKNVLCNLSHASLFAFFQLESGTFLLKQALDCNPTYVSHRDMIAEVYHYA